MSGEIHSSPGDNRPHQQGAAQGDAPGGGRANEQKNWLIDTGATISSITPANLAHFTPSHISWGAGQGAFGTPVPVQIVEGITMLFQTEDENGVGHNLSCNLPLLISNVDLIGNDQLAHLHVTVHWNAETGTGKLTTPAPRRRG